MRIESVTPHASPIRSRMITVLLGIHVEFVSRHCRQNVVELRSVDDFRSVVCGHEGTRSGLSCNEERMMHVYQQVTGLHPSRNKDIDVFAKQNYFYYYSKNNAHAIAVHPVELGSEP